MKTIKTLFLLSCVTVLFSCAEECKTCTVGITAFTWADGLSSSEIADMDEMYQLLEYENAQAYYDELAASITTAGVEYCGDELETMEATPPTVIPGSYTYGVTCVE